MNTPRVELITSSDGSHSLYHRELNETYHSKHGALQESKYVYIQQGIHTLLPKNTIDVIEVGFGTGLNALLTYNWALEHDVLVRYTTIEPFPVSLATVQQLNYSALTEVPESIFTTLHESAFNTNIELHSNFILYKYSKLLEDLSLPKESFDICFFDAFAPSKQPDIWSATNFSMLYTALRKEGILVTYCAQGNFKRTLQQIGYRVEAIKGPPFKKEMTKACKS